MGVSLPAAVLFLSSLVVAVSPPTISVALRGAEIAAVAESFARLSGSELWLHPEVKGTVDLSVSGVTWTTALDAACESLGCQWSLAEGVLELLPRAEPGEVGPYDVPVSIDLDEAPLEDVLASLAKVAALTIEIDGELDRTVTIGLRRVSLRTALRAVCESEGCAWELSEGVLRVRALTPPDPSPSSTPR